MSAGADLLKLGIEPVPARKSASHGEAGYQRRPRDAYFTEPWVTRALLAAVDFRAPGDYCSVIWEPACGDGRMAREIAAAGYRVVATDIENYGYGRPGVDFLAERHAVAASGIITNPPFDLARQFILHALDLTRAQGGKVAILQRHEFDAPRSNWPLFEPPFAAKLNLHKRPRWADGPDKASPRFAYSWFLWDWGWVGEPVLRFLPDPTEHTSGRML